MCLRLKKWDKGEVHCTNIVYLMLYVFTMNWTTPINVTDIYLMHAPKTWSFGSWIYIYLYNHLPSPFCDVNFHLWLGEFDTTFVVADHWVSQVTPIFPSNTLCPNPFFRLETVAFLSNVTHVIKMVAMLTHK